MIRINSREDLIRFLKKHINKISPYPLTQQQKKNFDCMITDEMYIKIMKQYKKVSRQSPKLKQDGGKKTRRRRRRGRKTRKKQQGGFLIESMIMGVGFFALFSIAMCCILTPIVGAAVGAARLSECITQRREAAARRVAAEEQKILQDREDERSRSIGRRHSLRRRRRNQEIEDGILSVVHKTPEQLAAESLEAAQAAGDVMYISSGSED